MSVRLLLDLKDIVIKKPRRKSTKTRVGWRSLPLTAPPRGPWRERELRGDKPGHKFHGNQFGGTGRVEAQHTPEEVLAHPSVRALTSDPTKIDAGGVGVYHDTAMETIAHVQGFDGKPTVVKEFSTNTKGDVQYRGVHDVEGKGYVEAFRTGDYFAGQGVAGSGTYTTNVREQAEGYGQHGGVLTMKLKSDARVISRKDADALYATEYHKYDPKTQAGEAKIVGDPGRAAAMHGYDAIDTGKYILVLNRTAVEVLDT